MQISGQIFNDMAEAPNFSVVSNCVINMWERLDEFGT